MNDSGDTYLFKQPLSPCKVKRRPYKDESEAVKSNGGATYVFKQSLILPKLKDDLTWDVSEAVKCTSGDIFLLRLCLTCLKTEGNSCLT